MIDSYNKIIFVLPPGVPVAYYCSLVTLKKKIIPTQVVESSIVSVSLFIVWL